jgi:ferrochelatase
VPYDAFLLLSFGGPEKRDDVIPFLENVLRGRNVPRERLLEVAEHYYHFDGVSPINAQNRSLISALQSEIQLPIYWGNRNWHPLLADTVTQMRDAGVKRAVALATSAFGSYSGCQQYREDIDRARAAVPGAPEIDKLPPFSTHPAFIETMIDRVRDAAAKLPGAEIIYTAHSIPVSMANSSPYQQELLAACEAVNTSLNLGVPTLVYQSRSGPPSQPWLGPDIRDYLSSTRNRKVIVVPVGFLSDHMEVLYDLDTEAAALASELGIEFVRAATAGTHPSFVRGIREMVEAAMLNPPQPCPTDCCPPPQRPRA